MGLNNAACLYQAEGLMPMRNVCSTRPSRLPNECPVRRPLLTGTITGNMAFRGRAGLWMGAALYQRALVIQQQQLGLHHPTVGLLADRYARVLDLLGRPGGRVICGAGCVDSRTNAVRSGQTRGRPVARGPMVGEIRR